MYNLHVQRLLTIAVRKKHYYFFLSGMNKTLSFWKIILKSIIMRSSFNFILIISCLAFLSFQSRTVSWIELEILRLSVTDQKLLKDWSHSVLQVVLVVVDVHLKGFPVWTWPNVGGLPGLMIADLQAPPHCHLQCSRIDFPGAVKQMTTI